MFQSLQQIADGRKAVGFDVLNRNENAAAAVELQTRLCDLGLLDPIIDGGPTTPFMPVAKADGIIGINTRSALYEFCRLARLRYDGAKLPPDIARALIGAQADSFLRLQLANDSTDDISTRLAKKVLRYMQQKGYWIARSPNMYNIAYVEGMNADGSLNNDKFNEWNDRRLVIRIQQSGKPQLLVNDQATTEPGSTYTTTPQHPQGAARIAFGQYKAWAKGLHQGRQPALVQRGPVRVHRDFDKNGKRSASDPVDIGTTFGINHHSTAPNVVPATIGPYSAGCLVGRRYAWHLLFLKTVQKDVRFLLNNNYLFLTTVIAGDDM